MYIDKNIGKIQIVQSLRFGHHQTQYDLYHLDALNSSTCEYCNLEGTIDRAIWPCNKYEQEIRKLKKKRYYF